MITYFADRKLNIIGLASTNLQQTYVIKDDKTTEDTETGISVLDLTVAWASGEQTGLQDMMEAGNYVLKTGSDEEATLYTIVEEEIDTKAQTIDVYCEDAGLDFINDVAPAYEAGAAYIAQYYINKYIGDSGFEVGIDELSTSTTRQLSWDGETTIAERLQSVANSFGCELAYSYLVEGMKVTHKYVNIYAKRGDQKTLPQLRLNLEIDKIITKKSIENLATAFSVTGGTPKGSNTPINLKGYAYDDGSYYVDKTSGYVISKSGQAEWTRLINKTFNTPVSDALSGQIVKTYTYDSTDKAVLVSHAIAELKKVDHAEVNYDIEIPQLPEGIRIGDRISIIDDEGELYLSSRILKLETSVTQQSVKATLGEYVLKTSGISEQIEALADQWSTISKKLVYYTWAAYADDSSGTNISVSPDGKKYMGIATNRQVETVDISDPSVFVWALIQGSQGDKGAAGRGIASSDIAYAESASGTVAPTTGWQTTIPSVAAGHFLWTRTVTNYTDSTSVTTYGVSKIGDTGSKGDPGDPGASGEDAVNMVIASSDGAVFKTGSISTTLTAHVYKGGVEVTGDALTALGTIKWYKDGGTTVIGTGSTLTVNVGAAIDVTTYTAQLEA